MPLSKKRERKRGLNPTQSIDRILQFLEKQELVASGQKSFTVPEIEPGRRYLHLYISQALRHLIALGYFRVSGTVPRFYFVIPGSYQDLRSKRDSVKGLNQI